MEGGDQHLEFDGTQGKVFFQPTPDGYATVWINGATFSISGLKPLVDGASYQLMIAPTPTPNPEAVTEHEVGPKSQG